MSGSGPPEGFNPFESLLGDLGRIFSQQGPINWDIARQIAVLMATEGQAEANVEPLERMRLEELVRVADLHVADATGMSTSLTGRTLTVAPVTHGEWARRSLDDLRALFGGLAESFGQATVDDPIDDVADHEADAGARLLGDMGKLLGPVMLGFSTGSMLGHLSRRCMGQYDLPIPRPAGDELLVVPSTIDAFAEEWSLEPDDLRLWVCLREVTHHAVLGRPHVRDRLESLISRYVSSFQVDAAALESSLGDLDITDPASMQASFLDTDALLGAVQGPGQQDLLTRIEALTTPIEGFVDHVMDAVGRSLIGSYAKLTEALRRRRVEATDADRFVERLLGLQLGPETYGRGQAFVDGVVERAGDEGLARLWASERELPTPAELDAPGLWLARIDLPA